MPDLFPEVTLEEQISCLDREIAQRERVYPRLIVDKKMTQDFADYQIRAMKSARASLCRLRGLGG